MRSHAFLLERVREIAEEARTAPERAKAKTAELLAEHNIPENDPLGYRLACEHGTLLAYVATIAAHLDALVAAVPKPRARGHRR